MIPWKWYRERKVIQLDSRKSMWIGMGPRWSPNYREQEATVRIHLTDDENGITLEVNENPKQARLIANMILRAADTIDLVNSYRD